MDEYENFLDKSKKMYSIYEEKSKYIFNVNINSSETIEKIIDSAISKGEKDEIVYNDVDGKQYKRIIHPLYLFRYKKNIM